jgi:hypothetical protein
MIEKYKSPLIESEEVTAKRVDASPWVDLLDPTSGNTYYFDEKGTQHDFMGSPVLYPSNQILRY